MKLKYQLRYIILPAHAYKDNRLNYTSARVYGFIHSYTNPFFFSNEHLAEMFGVHEQTISTAVKQLEEMGYIKTEYKVKADGGKTRLCVDAHSDSAKTLSRKTENRAPTKRKHSDKDIKENNIMSKKESNSLDNIDEQVDVDGYKDKGWLERRKARKQRKRSGLPPQGRIKINPMPYKNEKQPLFREKKGAHGEHII